MDDKFHKPIAISFHGFLGSPDDFKFLSTNFRTYSLDLKPKSLALTSDKSDSQSSFESWPHLLDRLSTELNNILNEIETHPNTFEVFVFSYSMGSKALFSILNKHQDIFKNKNIKLNLVLLSTYFGLYDDNLKQEQEFRADLNAKFLKILSDGDLEKFLKEWSSLSLFAADDESQLKTSWTKSQIEHYFKFWNQSQLVDQTNTLMSYPFVNSVNVVYGEQDLKYKDQAKRFQKKIDLNSSRIFKFVELPGRGHRLLTDSDLNFIVSQLEVIGT